MGLDNLNEEVLKVTGELELEGVDQSEESEEAPAFDLEAFAKSLTSDFDKRFSGFQSMLDQREDKFRKELEQLKTANLTPEEQEQLQASSAQEELSRMKRENELLKMRRQFPEEVDLLEDFFGKTNLQEQLSLLSKFRKAQAEAESNDSPEEQPNTPVDKNNSPRKNEPSIAEMQGEMTPQLADKILSAGNEKGFLRRLRKG